jgi:ADP-ribosylglycohydrolase
MDMLHKRETKPRSKNKMEIENLARGCLVGAFVGDSAGARLEFLGRRPDNAQLDDALAMKGGGVFRVAPGQITDDGEFTLALARALEGAMEYPREKVATNYRAWVASRPFDIGNATSAALGGAAVGDSEVADAVSTNAAKNNFASKANGALMRASALGIWSVRLTVEEAVAAARADACLTHPNLTCQWASAAYVAATRHLLLYPGDGAGAFAEAECVLNGTPDDGIIEVRSWLKDAGRGSLPDCHPLAGFVRIAFTHALHHLHRETPFEDAVRQVLADGGDTDTNACIVGGLVGARVGLAAIPEQMSRAVLECDTAKGRPRPPWLQTRDALTVTTALLT